MKKTYRIEFEYLNQKEGNIRTQWFDALNDIEAISRFKQFSNNLEYKVTLYCGGRIICFAEKF